MLLLATCDFILYLKKQVILTKNVEFMPLYLSVFSFLASTFWMAYGLLCHDLFLAVCLSSSYICCETTTSIS